MIFRLLVSIAFLWVSTGCFYDTFLRLQSAVDGIDSSASDLAMLIFLFLFSVNLLFSAVTILLKKRIGVRSGYFVPPVIFLMFVGEALSHWEQTGAFMLEDYLWSSLFLATPFLLFFGLRKISKQF